MMAYLPMELFTNVVRIMFGMSAKGNNFFLIGERRYRLVEVEGPIAREGKHSFAQFDHDRKILRVCRNISEVEKNFIAQI